MHNDERLEQEITIPAGRVLLSGTLSRPSPAQAVIVFAPGNGSSRYSPGNRTLSDLFNRAGYATLLFDLLTAEEEAADAKTGELRFDIGKLASRLVAASAWLIAYEDTRLLRLAYFAASTGTAVALQASTELPRSVQALVSRGGRPDLAAAVLGSVVAPTLFIVGERDKGILELNRHALNGLSCQKQLDVVPGASHMFEESGALDAVARLSISWFDRYLEWPQKRQSSAS